jgi:hypothetical protein
MVDDLRTLWQDLTLTEEESVEVVVQGRDVEKVVERGTSCLVGKLLADRIIGKDTIRSKLV